MERLYFNIVNNFPHTLTVLSTIILEPLELYSVLRSLNMASVRVPQSSWKQNLTLFGGYAVFFLYS